MRGRLFHILSVTSMVLGILLVICREATSDKTRLIEIWVNSNAAYAIGSYGGFISIGRLQFHPIPPDATARFMLESTVISWRADLGAGPGNMASTFFFDLYDMPLTQGAGLYEAGLESFRVLSIGYGTPIVLTAVLPAIRLYLARRRQKRQAT